MKRFGILKLAVLLSFVLAACVPVQQAAQDLIKAVAAEGDPAILILESTTVSFVPNGSVQDVGLYIGGNSLVVADDRCYVEGNGIACKLGDLTEAESVAFTGERVSANVSYYRDGDLNFFYIRPLAEDESDG